MSSDIVILDDIFDKDSLPNIQSDLISKIEKYRASTVDDENWCLLKTEHQFKHFCLKIINIAADHFDLSFPHKGAIFYVNTNDGFTVLEDGTEIKSIENRVLLFDPSTKHHSTTCTDKKVRITINFNYF